MTHSLIINNVMPLVQYNEYEGYIEGVIQGRKVCCYVMIYDQADWNRFKPGVDAVVDIWLERSGPVEKIEDDRAPALIQKREALYIAVGVVQEINGEMVMIDSVLPLRIDLDVSLFSPHPIPALQVGDRVSVEGILKADLYPDDDV